MLYQLAFRSKVQSEDEEDINIANLYNDMALNQVNLKKFSDAIPIFERALRIFAEQDENSPHVAAVHNNIAEARIALGDFETAMLHLGKVNEIERKVFPKDHPTHISTFINIGIAYSGMKRYLDAVSYLEGAISLAKKNNIQKFIFQGGQLLGPVYKKL